MSKKSINNWLNIMTNSIPNCIFCKDGMFIIYTNRNKESTYRCRSCKTCIISDKHYNILAIYWYIKKPSPYMYGWEKLDKNGILYLNDWGFGC